ncbi:MAG: hydrophobe/amphiphile efflux family transporter, partial [Burkholderiaceae bacterium]|nr:hydrophobe/amphiphile efflux family transporter [Burkholderiaceae bacterium]
NSRHSIGTGVIGGTLVATLVAIFFIPMFYWLLETLSARLFGSPDRGAAPAAGEPAVAAAVPAGEPAPQTRDPRQGDR